MDLSIVIPVYNEQYKIVNDINTASEFLNENNMTGEIIVVNDGSTDRTSEIVKSITVREGIALELIDEKEHIGKGYAVKTGMLRASGDRIMFIDSGNCVPYDNILKGLELINGKECMIAHGSRFHPGSRIMRPMKTSRKLASYLFRKYIHIRSRIPKELKDTQCGLKIYEKKVARELYTECITKGFMFDVEIILRAKNKSYGIREFPVEWTSDPDSRLSIQKVFFNIFRELRIIRKVLKT